MKRPEASQHAPAGATAQDLAGALHEVSNALTVVIGWLDAARGGDAGVPPSEEQLRQAVDVARSHARRGYVVARKAIGAEIQGDRVATDSSDAAVVAEDAETSALCVAQDALLGISPEAEQRGIGLELQRLGASGAMLRDGNRAVQILLNLLLNALSFSKQGGRVRLSLRGEGGCVVFGVRDSGPGVPPELASTLFDAPVSTRQGGAGIGLAHSADLAERYGGRLILADRGEGVGALFELSWPIAEMRSGLRHPVAPRPAALHGRRVLVVEDDEAVLSLIELTLETRGVQVEAVSSQDDLEALMGGAGLSDVDAVLVDLSPFGDDPAAGLRRLRASLQGEPPVLLISGSPNGVPDGVQGAVSAWVRKPFEMGELIEALQAQLRS